MKYVIRSRSFLRKGIEFKYCVVVFELLVKSCLVFPGKLSQVHGEINTVFLIDFAS
jgi:hypothetical protein